ncbi:MAG: DUF4199 domain-containing protein [Bacteroidales bacterium]|nr:DUF4199 domain-containing protein [Bacteroidales bacterium]
MENQGKSLNENALYFGVLTGLALIIYSLVLYIFNQSANQTLGYFSLIFLAIGVFLAAKIFRDQSQEGFITYGRALGVSILTAFYASLLLAVYMYVFYKFIDPEAIKPMLDAAEQEMYRQGIEGQGAGYGPEYDREIYETGIDGRYGSAEQYFLGNGDCFDYFNFCEKGTETIDGWMYRW